MAASSAQCQQDCSILCATPGQPPNGCRAERDNGGGFVTGFVVGGAIFGALGFLFAPQISAALLNDEQRLRLPKFLDEEEKSPEATKQVCRPPLSSTIPAEGLGSLPQFHEHLHS